MQMLLLLLWVLLANLFTSYHERTSIQKYYRILSYYKGFIDDTLCVFKSETESNNILDYISPQHDNTKFKMETEMLL